MRKHKILTMKRVLSVMAMLFLVTKIYAQQDPQFSQNMFLTAPVNPGAAGIKGMHCVDLVARQQWTGFEGKPETGLLSYNAPISVFSNFGFGGVLTYDRLGPEESVFFKLNGAYHINVGSDGGKLGIGVDLGIIQKSIGKDLKAADASDALVASLAGASDMGFDVGFGLFYFKPNLYFGISGQKLLPQQLSLGMANPKIRQHAYITTGYVHHASTKIVLKPNMLVKTDLTSTQIDVNLTAFYNGNFWLGGSYRVQDAVVANVGFKTQGVKIGFAYDFTTQGLANPGTFTKWDDQGDVAEKIENNRSFGGVELYLGFCIMPPPPAGLEIYVDPLFL
jgi:type IX secretion system PorP/SprF family membrane protein